MNASAPIVEGAVFLAFDLPLFMAYSFAAFFTGFWMRKTMRKFAYLAGGTYYDG
ncbi:hypothetical protein [Craterilacuibacter sp. RT1T]|uniref:hypothetical protein n=1 Tax=Craterilacuibacter sp. RT1T TaxID=2942211 RepID=UPI0020BE5B06|nr:hypothetical protein [Craterilacuibacter sp. RT1T]MCL6263161.1 hypothetical protein [Craterilacuibacter sp. RT1T]